MTLRSGRKNGHTLYIQGGVEPSDDDEFVGALGYPHLVEVVVNRYNDFPVLNQRFLDMQRERDDAVALAEQRRLEIQRLQRPVMSEDAKADVEAAYQRGLQAGMQRVQDRGLQDDRAFGRILMPVLKTAADLEGQVHRLTAELAEVYAQTTALLNPCVAAAGEDEEPHEHVYGGASDRCTAAGCPDPVRVGEPDETPPNTFAAGLTTREEKDSG